MNPALAKLKKLKDVYIQYLEVPVGPDLKVKLKLLSSQEETEVHEYALSNFEQGIAYLYAIKRATLCWSIVNLNDTDIPEFVEDQKEGGEAEKVQRHIWLRENIVSGWNQMLVDKIWKGYSDLMEKVEAKISGGIKKEEEKKEEEKKEEEKEENQVEKKDE